MYAADDAELPLIGEITLDFRVEELWTSVRVSVTEALDSLVLGIDWLQDNNCVWEFGPGIFKIRGLSGKLKDKQSRTMVRRLFVGEKTMVPAKQKAHIAVVTTLPSLTASGTWAVQPKANNQDILIARTLHETKTIQSVVRVVNLSEKCRRFHKGDLVTEAELVKIVGEASLDSKEVIKIFQMVFHTNGP